MSVVDIQEPLYFTKRLQNKYEWYFLFYKQHYGNKERKTYPSTGGKELFVSQFLRYWLVKLTRTARMKKKLYRSLFKIGQGTYEPCPQMYVITWTLFADKYVTSWTQVSGCDPIFIWDAGQQFYLWIRSLEWPRHLPIFREGEIRRQISKLRATRIT